MDVLLEILEIDVLPEALEMEENELAPTENTEKTLEF